MPTPRRKSKPRNVGKTSDPAQTPPKGPTLAEEEQRQFHATHFTADPRGAAMAGEPPPGAAKRRRKRRGGAGPA